MARITFTSARPWRWIAADLLETLRLAQIEIDSPGAARRAGKDINAIINAAIGAASTEDDNVTH
jgi:hypothetical protein